MKKLFTFLIFLFVFSSSMAQSAKDIIDNHIRAIGGSHNWLKISSMQIDAVMQISGTNVPVRRRIAHDKAMRMDFSISGIDAWQILTKTAGWLYMPFGGETNITALETDEVRESQGELSVWDEFINYDQLGKKVSLVGKDELDGKQTYKLKMIDADGHESYFWLDATTFYTLKQVQKTSDPKRPADVITRYGQYRQVAEGIVYPFSIVTDEGPIEVKTLQINASFDESIFKPALPK